MIRSRGPLARFPLSTSELELLVALEAGHGLSALAEIFGRDASVISRQLKRLAEVAPVIDKVKGRWTLNAQGRRLALWARGAAMSLHRSLARRSALRIGTNREFAARVLGPQVAQFLRGFDESAELVVVTNESGVEELLLAGEVDVGFDCGRPHNPEVRFKMVKSEPFAICGAKSIFSPMPTSLEELLARPCLEYTRVTLARYLRLGAEIAPRAHFNDLAALRAACAAGLGWTILPLYCVRDELAEGSLVRCDAVEIQPDHYGVWWLRGANPPDGLVEHAIRWLEKLTL
jgi:DNA-binding transcriptional LysR family regulator